MTSSGKEYSQEEISSSKLESIEIKVPICPKASMRKKKNNTEKNFFIPNLYSLHISSSLSKPRQRYKNQQKNDTNSSLILKITSHTSKAVKE